MRASADDGPAATARHWEATGDGRARREPRGTRGPSRQEAGLASAARIPSDPRTRPFLAAGLVLGALVTGFGEVRAQTQRQIGHYTVTERQIGPWLLKSSAGRFGAYCTIERHEAGQTLGFQVTRSGGRFIGLSSTSWNRPAGTFEPVRVSVGKRTLWSGQAGAPVPEALVLPIEARSRIDPAALLTGGDSARVEVSGQVLHFALSGVAEALRAQRDCLAEAR